MYTFQYAALFDEIIKEWLYTHFNKGIDIVDLEKSSQWHDEKEECLKFFDAVELLKASNDPISELDHITFFPEIPDLYLFAKGSWAAYYCLDEKAKVLFGFLVTSDGLSPNDHYGLILQTMPRIYRKRNV